MSGFLPNVNFITPTDLGFWGIWLGCEGAGFRDPPVSNRGILVVIFCTEVSNSGSFLMYAWKSLSRSNLSFRVSGISFLHMSVGLIDGSSGSVSCVILVGDGGGDVDTRSTTFSAVEVFVLFTFFGQPCYAPASTNFWNCASIEILLAVESSMMETAMEANSSSSSDDSSMISLCFPFPCFCS